MKAIVYTKYGSPKNLKLTELNKPSPKDNEVLVNIKATSINSWDWDMLTGKPYIYRLLHGLLKPKYNIMGIDIAGVVEAVGSEVKDFKPGDEVYGDVSDSGFGAFAEYVCTRPDLLAIKPVNATFKQAAALPHGGVLALQSVNFNGELTTGQQVLINGAGGSTGPIALQLAKLQGAIVTCVDTADKFEFMKQLGADYCIDYRKEDYTKMGKQYNLIIDLVAHKSVFDYKRVLIENGALTIVGGSPRRLIQVAFIGALISKFTNKKIGLLMHRPGTENLNKLKQLYEEGKIKAIIDKTYPLDKVTEAIQRLGEGQALGKVVVSLK